MTTGTQAALTPEAVTQLLDNLTTRLEAVERAAGSSTLDLPETLATYSERLTELGQKVAEQGEEVKALDEGLIGALEARLSELEAAQERSVADSKALADSMGGVRDQLDAVLTSLDQLARPPAGAPVTAGPVTGGVHRKVLTLMREVEVIEKTREAKSDSGGPRYNFRGIDEVMDEVGRAMRQIGLTLTPTVVKHEFAQHPVQNPGRNGTRTVIWTTVFLHVLYTFTDPEDGSSVTFSMVGEGKDPSDKATSKAASMALKYGLLQALMIAVQGMNESDGDHQVTEYDQAPQEQPPQLSDEEKLRKAHDAFDAINSLHHMTTKDGSRRLTLDEQGEQLRRIDTWCTKHGVDQVVVQGVPLRAHLDGANATFMRTKAAQELDERRAMQAAQQDFQNALGPNQYGNYADGSNVADGEH